MRLLLCCSTTTLKILKPSLPQEIAVLHTINQQDLKETNLNLEEEIADYVRNWKLHRQVNYKLSILLRI